MCKKWNGCNNGVYVMPGLVFLFPALINIFLIIAPPAYGGYHAAPPPAATTNVSSWT